MCKSLNLLKAQISLRPLAKQIAGCGFCLTSSEVLILQILYVLFWFFLPLFTEKLLISENKSFYLVNGKVQLCYLHLLDYSLSVVWK